MFVVAFVNSNVSIINKFDFTLPNASHFCVSFDMVFFYVFQVPQMTIQKL